jgi:hypothetical protein
MKRLLLLLGAVVALIGTMGLAMFGGAIVGVFEVLIFSSVDPPDPPPAALAELQWAVMSAMALVVGLATSCVATVMKGNGQVTSTIGRLLYIGAGVSLVIGAASLAGGIMSVQDSFRTIAISASRTNPESIRDVIQSAELAMTIGYAMSVFSTVLLLVAGSAEFQARRPQADETRAGLSVAVAIGSVLLGVVLSLFLFSIWLSGNAIGVMIAETSVVPKPAELAEHLAVILSRSLFVFGGLATLGLLQLAASIIAPSMRPDADSEL